jgi:hypothetical protein
LLRKILFTFCFLLVLSTGWGKERIYIYDLAKDPAEKEAILILPGFGSRIHGTQKIADYFFKGQYDVFIPDYISRKSIEQCTKNLDEFILKYKLSNYKKVHVFSYIVGSWTLNNWINIHPKNNIVSIVYDRSPLQERAPYALVKDIPFIIRLIAGPIMKEFSKTPYPPLNTNTMSVGILIESKATKLIQKHKRSALRPGPVSWEADSLHQRYNDRLYTWLNHDDMYTRFDVIGADILHFFAVGIFTPPARRFPYTEDPFIPYEEKK